MKSSLHIRRVAALLLTLCLLPWGLMSVSAAERDGGETYPVCYQQKDPRWGSQEQLAPGGCGILALVNAVHYLTGNFIDPVELAAYARSIDAYYGSVGGGTARWVLYHQLDQFEKKYGFDVVETGRDADAKHKTLLNHLAKGGTAVAHVPGHFIALCGYDAATDSILVYDSAATPDRKTTTEAAWHTTDFLTSHYRMKVDWWCLLERTGETQVTVEELDETGKNRELFPTIWYGQGSDEQLVLKGSVRHTSALDTLFYVLDYDCDQVIETAYDLGGNRSASFELPLDVSGWKTGRYTLRLSARGKNGSVVDIAEYTLVITDGRAGFDPATGALTVNMSGFADQLGVTDKVSSLDMEGYAFRSSNGSSLWLGSYDLSQYTAVRFYYSVKKEFFGKTEAAISLRSASGGFKTAEDENIVVSAPIPEADLELTDIQTVTLDLTDCDHKGDLWLAVQHPTWKFLYIREVKFYTGEITADTEAPTEAPTDPETEPATAPEESAAVPEDTAAPEETAPETTAEPALGCGATLTAGLSMACLVVPAALALTARKGEGRERRKTRRK